MANTPPNKTAAWVRNGIVLAAMTLLIVCGVGVCGPETDVPAPKVVAQPPPPAPPLPVAPPPEPFVEPEPEPVAAVAPVAAPPPEPAAAPPPVVPVVAAAAAPVVAVAAAAPVAAPPPVSAPPPPMPAPGPAYLPIGTAADQFPTLPPDVAAGSALAINFNPRPGLPQTNQSPTVIQPCEAAPSCTASIAGPTGGPLGFTIVGGGWPPAAPLN